MTYLQAQHDTPTLEMADLRFLDSQQSRQLRRERLALR